MAVQPGQTWSYWVQSVHDFGVTSNLSAPLTVTVPYPAPKSFVPNLTAADVPDDDGGALNVSWSAGDPSIAAHQIFVFSNDFNDVSQRNTGLKTDATIRSIHVVEDSDGAPLVDGTGYYIAVIGIDATATPRPTSPLSDPFSLATTRNCPPPSTFSTPTSPAINTTHFSSLEPGG